MTTTTATLEPDDAGRGMRDFLVIWVGQLISMLGSGLTGFALGVWIFDQTKQATPFALTVLLGSIPRLLLLPVAGSLADRWNRRWIMILADTGSALTTLAVAVLLLFGNLQIWHIYLVSVIGSVFAAFQEPAYTASITMLVPKKALGRANGLVQMGQALESIITPLLAGGLFVAIGLRGIIWIDFATFFFAIAALMVIRIPQPEAKTQTGAAKPSLWRDTAFGWQYLRQRPGLLGLLFYFAMINFLLNWSGVLATPMVLSNNPASTLGVIQMAVGIGMLAGSIVMSSWGGPKRRIPAVIGFIALGLAGYIVAGIRPHPAFVGAGLFVLMFFIPLASGNSQAVFQTKVAPDVQGRVFSIRALVARSMMPLGFLTAGPLADLIFEPLMREGGALAQGVLGSILGVGTGRGIGLMFVLSGLFALIASALAYANPRIRNVEAELPDAIPDHPV